MSLSDMHCIVLLDFAYNILFRTILPKSYKLVLQTNLIYEIEFVLGSRSLIYHIDFEHTHKWHILRSENVYKFKHYALHNYLLDFAYNNESYMF